MRTSKYAWKMTSLRLAMLLGLLIVVIAEEHILKRWLAVIFFVAWCVFVLALAGEARHRGLVQRIRRGLCVKCGYNLTGNTSGVCPECGTAVSGKANA